MSFHLFPLSIMTTAHRFLSLSVLGTMALAIAPIAGAQGFSFGGGMQSRGHMGFSGQDIDSETRAEIRAELQACREDNQEDHDAAKACADAVFEANGIEKPQRPERGDRPEITEEIRIKLEACREDNQEDHETAKACADAVFEANGIEKPANRPGRRMGHQFRSSIDEACGEREDTDEWKTCAQEARGDTRSEFREKRSERRGLFSSTDLRSELRACLDLDDSEQLRECVFGVRADIRANLQNQ